MDGHRFGHLAKFCSGFLRQLFVEVGDDNFRSLLRERLRRVFADSLAAAGDNDNFSFEHELPPSIWNYIKANIAKRKSIQREIQKAKKRSSLARLRERAKGGGRREGRSPSPQSSPVKGEEVRQSPIDPQRLETVFEANRAKPETASALRRVQPVDETAVIQLADEARIDQVLYF